MDRQKIFLSLNLRRFGNETLADTTALLKIEVPCIYASKEVNWFTFEYDSVMAIFDSIPATSYSYTNPNNRGKALDLVDTSYVSVFYIRAYMLPPDNEDITISALIDFGDGENKLLKSGFGINRESLNKIDSLKIKVTYLSNEVPLAIDWVRFETPNTRKLLWGHNDENIIEGVQEAFDSLSKPSYANRGIKPFRITVNIEGSLINWASERYMSKLIGNIITGSNGPILPDHYNHYINAPDRWLNLYSFKSSVATPISESNEIPKDTIFRGLDMFVNKNLWKTLGNLQGYKIHPNSNYSFDPFKSGYETFLRSGKTVSDMRSADFDTYMHYNNIQFVALPISKLAYWESFLYKVLVNPLYSGTMYEDKPWYSQCFTGSDWVQDQIYHQEDSSLDKICSVVDHGMRVTTTEELRLMNWISIIQGAKGLFYDTSQEFLHHDGTRYSRMSIPASDLSENTENYEGLEFLELDEIGSDFLGGDVDFLEIYSRIPEDKRSEIAQTMGTRTDRFYVGKKSTRLELRRLHEWVLNNEDFIMSQRLQAWFGCGYKIWENRHPRWGGTNIMRRFVNVDSVKTRKLYAVDSTGYSPSTGYEPNTDNFLDITILADKTDTNMTNGFTIGIQNRRTDPLIYFTETSNDHFLFLSSNEFETLCDSGGKNPMLPLSMDYPETLWQEYYWKRLGCREITIPFNYCDTTNNGSEYTLLRVTELKADNAYDDECSWWQKERYHNYIDTVIGQNSPLAIKFLPGEGKMLKVEILHPNPIAGNLAYSNQSKMVVYPVYVDGEPTDAVRYHTTYHKTDAERQDMMTVYYRRSLPRHIDSLNKQIIWEPEIKLSDTIVVKDAVGGTSPVENVPAYYPSIVVRNDGNTPKAYVVFHTEAENVYICDDPICDPAENPCRDYLNPICETILDVNGTIASVISKGIAIHQINHGHPDEWGTPVVNASANGNYYAWADSLCGIGVGFKAPNVEYLQDFTHLRFGSPDNEANHPSLNVYSAIDLDEGECSLVWQEKNDVGNSIIYYTKLLYGSTGITNYLANTIIRGTQDIQNGALRLSSNFESGRFPSIYRTMNDKEDTLYAVQIENVVWETKKSTEYRDLALLNIYHICTDTLNHYEIANVQNIKNIYGRSGSIFSPKNLLTNPTLSQTNSFRIKQGRNPYTLKSAFLLNFVDNWTNQLLSSSGKNIYHVMIPGVVFVKNEGLTIKDYNKTIYPVSEGMYPHLALSPYANNSTNIWKNHRIYEYGTLDGNPKIVPNPAYFYPFGECPNCQKTSINIGFGRNDQISYQKITNLKLTLPDFQSAPVSMKLPYVMVDTTDEYVEFTPRDTLYSEWWHLDSTAEFQYLVTFNDTNVVSLKLQKLSDSSFINLPAPYLPGSGFSFMVFYLVNGSNDDYRLAMINNLPAFCDYTEDLYFADQFVVDSVYAKGTYREIKNNVINLNPNSSDKMFKLVCHPNPAKDELNISVYSEQKKLVTESVNIGIYNQQGILIMELSSGINTNTIIPISNLMTGVYFIRANLSTTESAFSDVQKVLIVK